MIAKTLSHLATVHSFDLVAMNDRVTACDMSKVYLTIQSIGFHITYSIISQRYFKFPHLLFRYCSTFILFF